MTPIPDAVLEQTRRNIGSLRRDLAQEPPMRIHDRSVDAGGAPDWSAGFWAWVTRRGAYAGDAPKRRYDATPVAMALRALRRVSNLEYMAAYRVLVLGQSVSEVRDWLNARGGSYSEKDAAVLIICAIGKIADWV